jgi:hypothetical protein
MVVPGDVVFSVSDSPSPIAVAWSIWRSLRTVRPPRPTGSRLWDHRALAPPLLELARAGPRALPDLTGPLGLYVAEAERADPDLLTAGEALAFWINLYNAGALLLAAEASRTGEPSVLRVPGGFRRPFVTVAGEDLSLDAVEHAKLRRFGDPRIHAALVCGSVSCPTLRSEPYGGGDVSTQLDGQMRRLLADGAMVADRPTRRVELSRVFLWYGADFVRPHRMPTFLPAGRSRVLDALRQWMPPELAEWVTTARPAVGFQDYDWGLACAVR